MGHSIYFDALDSTDGFQTSVLEELDKRIKPDKVLLTVKTDGSDTLDKDNYIPVNYDICEQNRYQELLDLESLMPLSRELLEVMKPYELTAIRMLIRNHERDIYTMDESMRFYLRHLRFWHHMLVTNKIDFAFFSCTPHHTHDYVVYALSKVLGIKTCVCISTNFKYRYFLAESLDSAHKETYDIYLKKYKDMDPKLIKLPEDVESYFQTIHKGTKEQMRTQALQGNSFNQELLEKKELFTRELSLGRVLRKNLSNLKHHYFKGKSQTEKQRAIDGIKFKWGLYKRDRIKQGLMRGVDYYNSLARDPVEGERYIVYFLHYQPEATTLPQGGVFHDQELALSIMAKAAGEMGYKLYVKEHFVQYRRQKAFYDDIAAIPNVRLINTRVNSRDLTQGSLCGATGNGTVVLESVIRGTPMIVFGETGFGMCPGVHMAGNLKEAIQAIKEAEIERQQGISVDLIRAYLAAFAQNSLYSMVFSDSNLKKEDPDYAISRDCLVDVICNRIG